MRGKHHSSGRAALPIEKYNPHPGGCPYCGRPVAHSKESSFIYKGKDYGPVWYCTGMHLSACDAYIGCTRAGAAAGIAAVGTLADRTLRSLRRLCKVLFDEAVAINANYVVGGSVNPIFATRLWLAGELQIAEDDCYIPKLTSEQCQAAIHCLKQILNNTK